MLEEQNYSGNFRHETLGPGSGSVFPLSPDFMFIRYLRYEILQVVSYYYCRND